MQPDLSGQWISHGESLATLGSIFRGKMLEKVYMILHPFFCRKRLGTRKEVISFYYNNTKITE